MVFRLPKKILHHKKAEKKGIYQKASSSSSPKKNITARNTKRAEKEAFFIYSWEKEKWWHRDLNLMRYLPSTLGRILQLEITKQFYIGGGATIVFLLVFLFSYMITLNPPKFLYQKLNQSAPIAVANTNRKASSPANNIKPQVLGEETANNTNQNNNTAQPTNSQPVVEKQQQKTESQPAAKPNIVPVPQKKPTPLGYWLAAISLFFGLIFFLYAVKYYIVLVFILAFSKRNVNGNGNGFKNHFNGNHNGLQNHFNGNGHNHTNGRLNGFFNKVFQNGHHFVNHYTNGNGKNGKNGNHGQNGAVGLMPNLENIIPSKAPFFSVHLPFYNERKVADRILTACTSFDYSNYEVIVIDDSTDETTRILEKWKKHPRVKVIHREARTGFKGGALQVALDATNPKAEFITVFDADFIPYPDTLNQFLKYFLSSAINGNGNGNGNHRNSKNNGNGKSNGNGQSNGRSFNYAKSMIAAVQGYQWHVLNKGENWITKSVRSEFAGSYVIERPGTELFGSLKQIAGSVFMIRADVLKKYGWGTSITEDFELTLKLYQDGYKVIYTPYIQGPSECVASLSKLIRQRMRWAEGHTHNIKKHIWKILFSKKLIGREKVEFIYLAPYYLQATFLLIGSAAWLVSDFIMRIRLPFWTSLWGWSLVLTNLLALPLINAVGLFLEESERKDYAGLFSFVALSYILVPFQAYAALKGLFKKEQSPWFRTPKTGHITDKFVRFRFKKWFKPLFPAKKPAKKGLAIASKSYLELTTANNRFAEWQIKKRPVKGLAQGILAGLLVLAIILSIFARDVPMALAATTDYYLQENATSGPDPAGNYMNNIGTSSNAAVCESADLTPGCIHDSSNAVWYSYNTYPSGGDNGQIPGWQL